MNKIKNTAVTLLSKCISQIILMILVIFFALQVKGIFFTTTNLISIVRQVSTMGIAALGVSFLMITGNLDFSMGSIYAFVGTFTAILNLLNIHIVPAMLIAALCGIGISCFTCWISISFKIPRLISSMAMQQLINGLCVIIAGNKTVYGLPESIKWLGQGYIGIIPVSSILFAALAVLVAFVFNKTYFGRYLFAVGGNEDVARLSGINVNKIKYLASIIAGLLASIAGLISMSRTFSGSPYAGGTLSTDVISAAVLGGVSIMGGTGKTSGLVTGILIIGTLTVGLNMMNMNANSQDVFKGAMLLVAVILDSRSKGIKKLAMRR